MNRIPAVREYMTQVPRSIGFDQSLKEAREFMRDLRLRHLPVLKGGELVGIITDRDINLVLGFNDSDADTLKVEEAYTPDPYITNPGTPLNKVVAAMADNKYGCALVVENGKLVGIFTEIDAYRALAEVLEAQRYGDSLALVLT